MPKTAPAELAILPYDPERLKTCTACDLRESRTCVVLGQGPRKARVVIIGEAPGYHEDNTGRPFVGEAGAALDTMLAEAGLTRGSVYVTNSVKCRPTSVQPNGTIQNKKPSVKQIRACRQNFLSEMLALDPDIVVAMGATAVAMLYPTEKANLTSLRGTRIMTDFETRSGIKTLPVLATYHPAYALYNAAMTPSLVADLRVVKQYLDELDGNAVPDTASGTTATTICRTVPEVAALVEMLCQQPVVTFDTEAAAPDTVVKEPALDSRFTTPICVSFTTRAGEGYVVPIHGRLPLEKWDARASGGVPSFDWDDVEPVWTDAEHAEVLRLLRTFFESPTPKIAQNGKFDLHVLRNGGIPTVNGFTFDTMAAHSLLHEDDLHNSEALRAAYTPLGRYDTWKQTLPSKAAPYLLADTQDLWTYAAGDTDVTHRTAAALLRELNAAGPHLMNVYTTITHPLILSTYVIERNGFLVDRKALLVLQEKYARWITEVELALESRAWEAFNPGSPQQVAKLLYQKLGLPVLKTTETGQPSTDEKTLEELANTYPDAVELQLLRRHRKLVRMRNNYLGGADGRSGLLPYLDADNRIHTSYSVGLVPTGRLSSSKPNLQNIPKRKADILLDEDVTEEDLAIRKLFTAPPGYVIGEGDYSMLEVRLSALIWGETSLLAALERPDFDQHRLTASLINGIPEEQVTKDQRTYAKRATFATQYGGGVSAISRSTGWGPREAKDFLVRMQNAYPATEYGRRATADVLYRDGVVHNIYGRPRHFPVYRQARDASRLDSPEGKRAWREAGHMERVAFNFFSQSAGADTLSQALNTMVLRRPDLAKLGVVFCNTVHDSVNWYVPEQHAAEAARVIKDIMESIPSRYPHVAHWRLPAEVEWGYNWGQMSEHLAA